MLSRRGRLTRGLIGRVSSGEGSFSRHCAVVRVLVARRLLELMVLRRRSEREKEIEILLLGIRCGCWSVRSLVPR
jgi:hypothetical protein